MEPITPLALQVASAEDILHRIEVKPPYYALQDLQLCEGGVHALVTPEQPLHAETGPISGAEVGRHLAIIGSCALAAVNPKPGKHYYLAQHAAYRAGTSTPSASNEPLRASARVISLSGRTGSAQTELRGADGTTLVSLATTYQIMSEKVFAKLFATQHRSTPVPDANAFRLFTPFPAYQVGGAELTTRLTEVTAAQCAGHFEGCPSVPVAVLMGWLVRTASEHMRHLVDSESVRLQVLHADVAADRLAFAGEPITLATSHLATDGDIYRFQCRATDDAGALYGGMDLQLQMQPEDNSCAS